MRELVIDSNLLCLLVVGLTDPSLVNAHRRLQIYSSKDFQRVLEIADRFDGILTCPAVLAETSNLLRYDHEQSARACSRKLAEIVQRSEEALQSSISVVSDPAFDRLGFTDATLLLVSGLGATLLSDDVQLCLEAQRRSCRAINYNYLRDGAITVEQI